MCFILEILSTTICTYIFYHSLKKVLENRFNILTLCIISFWLMQVLPVIVKQFLGIDEHLSGYYKMYIAMNDPVTNIIYSFFIVFVEISLYLFSLKIKRRDNTVINSDKLNNFSQKPFLKHILFINMFIVIVPAVFSPDINIYKEFSYFYTHSVNEYSIEYIYHNTVMSYASIISFSSILGFYYVNKEKKYTPFVYLAIIIMTWINGKRTLFTISLFGMLIIDIIDKKYKNNKRKLIFKVLLFLCLICLYFFVYSQITGKFYTTTFNFQYSIYFSRMSNIDTCIYALLHNESILDYYGESILYDLFFWIPRVLWESKPVIYSKYFTSYVMDYGTVNIDWQFQTNIWTEYLSNFTFLGPLIAIFLLYSVAKISENSRSSFVYILGMIFTVLYTMYGFESILQNIFILWFFLLAFTKIKIKL